MLAPRCKHIHRRIRPVFPVSQAASSSGLMASAELPLPEKARVVLLVRSTCIFLTFLQYLLIKLDWAHLAFLYSCAGSLCLFDLWGSTPHERIEGEKNYWGHISLSVKVGQLFHWSALEDVVNMIIICHKHIIEDIIPTVIKMLWCGLAELTIWY